MAVCLYPVDNGTAIKIDKTIILIGRHPDCDVVLTNSRKISRKHCCLAQIDNRLVIRDLGSMNGVWVNGHRVHRQNDLSVGDELAVGDVAFKLALEQSSKGRNGAKSTGRKADAAADDVSGANAQPAERSDLSQDVPIPISESDEFDVQESESDSSDSLRLSDLMPEDDGDSGSFVPLVDH